MKWIYCLTLTFAVPVGASTAQEAPTLARGTRVRVTMPAGRVIGTLESIDSTTIVLRRQNGEVANVPRVQSTRVDVSGGPGSCSPGHRRTCIAVGFLAGGALGLAVGSFTASKCHPESGLGCSIVNRAGGAFAGALVGTVVGAVVGGEHWKTAALPTRLTFVPGLPGGLESARVVRVGVRVAF